MVKGISENPEEHNITLHTCDALLTYLKPLSTFIDKIIAPLRIEQYTPIELKEQLKLIITFDELKGIANIMWKSFFSLMKTIPNSEDKAGVGQFD